MNVALAAMVIGLHHDPKPTKTSTAATDIEESDEPTSTSSSSPTSTAPAESTTTAGPTTSSESEPAPPSSTTTTTTEQPTTSSTPLPPCHNSHDPACGEFSWETEPPPNTPADVKLTWDPTEIHVNVPVTFHLSASDGESPVVGWITCFYLPGYSPCLARTDGPASNTIGYGPWTLPFLPSTFAYDRSTTFDKPGDYEVWVDVITGSYRHGDECPGDPAQQNGVFPTYSCRDPYLDRFTRRFAVTVYP